VQQLLHTQQVKDKNRSVVADKARHNSTLLYEEEFPLAEEKVMGKGGQAEVEGLEDVGREGWHS